MPHTSPEAIEPKNIGPDFREPPAKVSQIDLNDQSLSPAFRQTGNDQMRQAINVAKLHDLLANPMNSNDREVAKRLIAALNLSGGLSSEWRAQLFGGCPCCSAAMQVQRASMFVSIVYEVQGPVKAASESFIRGALEDLIKSIKDPAIRQYFQNPKLSDKEMIAALSYLSSEQRLSLVEGIYLITVLKPEIADFLLEHADNLIHYMPVADRVELVNRLLKDKSPDQANAMIYLVLRSSESLKNLVDLVAGVGTEQLLNREVPELNEFVAQALIGPALRAVTFPEPPKPDATAEEVEQIRLKFESELNKIMGVIAVDPRLAETRVVLDALTTAAKDLQELKADLEEFKANPIKVLERLTVAIELARLEFRYGVNIATGEADFLSKMMFMDVFGIDLEKARWSLRDIANLREILSNIPEGHLLLTGRLREIELVPFLGVGVLGARYVDGKIKIAKWTLDSAEFGDEYQGKDPLVIVLTHEIGHGLQIGEGPSGIYINEKTGELFFGPGESWFDFDAFTDLSGWSLLRRDRVAKGSTDNTVTIDGKEYAIDKPVELNGRWVVISYNAKVNLAIIRDAYADFSHRDYAKASPWEDFAEAFSEYIHLPYRLIQDAPEKFLHLELEFHKYEGDAKIQEALKNSLATRRRMRELLEEAERNRKPKAPSVPEEEKKMAKVLSLDAARQRLRRSKAA